jgi:hypothetical protein
MQPLQHELYIGKQEDHEGPEQDKVVDTKGLLQYPFLGESIDKGISNPGSYVIETVFRLADGYQAEAADTTPCEYNDCR